MMTKEAKVEGSERLASTKKVGYFHLTSKVSSKSPNPSPSPSPSPSPTPPIPPSPSSSIWSDARKQSKPEPKNKVLPRSRESHTVRSSSRRKPVSVGKPVTLAFYQECSPEFMDCDSKAPDQMEYIPGLSMPHCPIPVPLALKHNVDGSSPRSSRSPSKVRSPRVLAGQGKKAGKTQESTMLPLPAHGIQPQRQSRILLAEDNKVNVMVAQSMMQRLGHKLEVVNNGAEAIEAVQRNSYDVILMVSVEIVNNACLRLNTTFTCVNRSGKWQFVTFLFAYYQCLDHFSTKLHLPHRTLSTIDPTIALYSDILFSLLRLCHSWICRTCVCQ